MENNKTKYLVISIPETHGELLEAIKNNSKKHKVSISQYVRTLLYTSLKTANDNKTRTTYLA